MQSFKTRPGGQPGPRLGFRVLAGSPGLTGSAGSILKKKNQNDVVLVQKKQKKQKSTGLSPGLDRVLPGQPGHRVDPPGFSFPRFFVNPARFRPRVGRAGFQNYDQEVCSLCGFRFEPCGCSYDGHWKLTWSLTSGPVGLVEVRASWPGHPR